MRCNKAKILVSASLDGELSRREQSALESHLGCCPACARDMSQFSAVRDTMTLWSDEEPSPWLKEGFAGKLEQFRQERLSFKPSRPRWVLGSVSAGAAAAFVAVGFLLHGLVYSPEIQPVPSPVKPPIAITAPETTIAVTDSDAHAETQTPPTVELVDPGSIEAPSLPVLARTVIASGTPETPRVPVATSTRPTVRDTAPVVSCGGPREVAPEHIDDLKTAMAGAVEVTVDGRISDSFGEAGLAMNETMELVRGVFQQTVDLMIADSLSPANGNVDTNGGSTI